MISKECFVYIQLPNSHETVTLGRFRWEKSRGTGIGTFAYGRRYLENLNAIPLDPFHLPLEEREFECTTNDGVFGPIRDASPDKWGRYIIEKNTPREEWNEIGYLLHSAEDRVGALSFGRGKVPPAPVRKFNQTVQLQNLIAAAHKLEQDQPIDEAEKALLIEGGTLGGARPKTVVERGRKLWLAKFPSSGDRHNFSKIEYATMKLAKDCGLRIPEIDLIQVGRKDVFLIERFDREWNTKANGYLRHHFVSGLTLLNLDEKDFGNWSYLDLADQMRRWIRKPADDLRELYQRILFNAFISNQDDHPRNHGFLQHVKGFRLSPAYDLVPGPATGISRYSAMTLGAYGRGFTKKNLLSKCEIFELDRAQAEGLYQNMKKKVSGWRRYFAGVSLTREDFRYLETAFQQEGLEVS